MNGKLKAVLVGGREDGKILMLEKAHPMISSVTQVMKKEGGGFEDIYRENYRLIDEGPPLKYEAEDSN